MHVTRWGRRAARTALVAGAMLAGAGAVSTACTDDPYTSPQAPVTGDPETGRMLLRDYGCTSCHQVSGVSAPQGRVGPSLTDFTERRAVAGVLPHTPENAVRWITDPTAVDPQTLMPDLGVTDQDAEAILAYLYSLD